MLYKATTSVAAFPAQGSREWWNLSDAERHAGSFADQRERMPTNEEYALMLQEIGGFDNEAPVTL